MSIIATYPSLPIPAQKKGLLCWADSFDPLNTGAQPANNTGISSLVSKEIQGLSFVQATGGNQPLYITNGFKTRPIIRFDGSNDNLQSNNASLAVTNSFTIICIAKLSSASNINQCLISKGNSSADPDYMFMINNGSVDNKFAFYNGTVFNTSVNTISNTADFNMYTMSWNGASPQMYINETPTANTSVMVNPTTVGGNAVLGGQGATTPTNFFNGDFMAALWYNVKLSAQDITDIYRYFANFRGLNA